MRKKQIKILSAMMFFVTAIPFTSSAAPLAEPVQGGYEEEVYARLIDDVLEYDEIPLLVANYNEVVVDIKDNLRDAMQDLEKNIDELNSQERKMEREAEIAMGSFHPDVINYMIQDMTLEAIADQMSSVLIGLEGNHGMATTIKSAEDAMIKIVQELMIQYDMLAKQKDMLVHLEALHKQTYEQMQNKFTLGLATQAELQSANLTWLETTNTITSLENGMKELKQSMIQLVGWEIEDDPQIAPILPMDITILEQFSLEEDTRIAIGSNQTVRELRAQEPGKTEGEISIRFHSITEAEEKVVVEMKSLYEDVLVKKTAYESAKYGYEGAVKQQGQFQRMYQQGMLSETDFIGAQMSYIQKKIGFETADLTLRKSVETYTWAKDGFLTLP